MTVCLARKGGHYSAVTVHKYMNMEMRLYSEETGLSARKTA